MSRLPFYKSPIDGAESAFSSNMTTGPVDVYELKRSQHHLLATIENNRIENA